VVQRNSVDRADRVARVMDDVSDFEGSDDEELLEDEPRSSDKTAARTWFRTVGCLLSDDSLDVRRVATGLLRSPAIAGGSEGPAVLRSPRKLLSL